jgi:hypothetical protein
MNRVYGRIKKEFIHQFFLSKESKKKFIINGWKSETERERERESERVRERERESERES